MNHSFLYGDDSVTLPIEGAARVDILNENETNPVADVREAFRHAVEEGAIGCPPLRERVHAGDSVTIVISDVTRMWMHQDVITELLVRYLHEKLGLPYADITVLVALGTHRPQTDDEMRKTASSFVFEHVACVNHDAHAPDLAELGITSRGTRVRLNALAIGRKVITIGGTVFHLLAGFGGGRKSIVPGIAGWDTIQQNHRMALDPVLPRPNPAVGLGLVPENPVHLDMQEAARMLAPAYSLNLCINGDGQYIGVFGGDIEPAWEASCHCVREAFTVPIDCRYDAVVASSGGYPKDIDLYQGSKTLINAMQAVKPGGTVLFFAECREGGGPAAFFDWLQPLSQGRLDEALRADFTIAGYIFYAICAFAREADIRMLTALNPRQAKEMNIRAVPDVHSLLFDFDFTGKTVAVMPHAANTVPRAWR